MSLLIIVYFVFVFANVLALIKPMKFVPPTMSSPLDNFIPPTMYGILDDFVASQSDENSDNPNMRTEKSISRTIHNSKSPNTSSSVNFIPPTIPTFVDKFKSSPSPRQSPIKKDRRDEIRKNPSSELDMDLYYVDQQGESTRVQEKFDFSSIK